MDQNEFIKLIKKNFINVDKLFFDNIEKYKIVLQNYANKFNLSKLINEDKIYSEYFYNSIIPYSKINFNEITTVLDIGSGSGIPGVIIKLIYPHIKLTIIEATTKKVEFLKILMSELNIKANIINKRAENISTNEYETFDLVTSRAVAALKVLLEISTPYCKINKYIVEPKSIKASDELLASSKIIKLLNLKLIDEIKFTSENEYFHDVLIFKKLAKTNHKYPRSWKEIIK